MRGVGRGVSSVYGPQGAWVVERMDVTGVVDPSVYLCPAAVVVAALGAIAVTGRVS